MFKKEDYSMRRKTLKFGVSFATVLVALGVCGQAEANDPPAPVQAACVTRAVNYATPFMDAGLQNGWPLSTWYFTAPWIGPTDHGAGCGVMTVLAAQRGVGQPIPPYRWFNLSLFVGTSDQDPECGGTYGYGVTNYVEVWSNNLADASHPQWWRRVASRTFSYCRSMQDGQAESIDFQFPMVCDDDHCDIPNQGTQYNIVVRTLDVYTGAPRWPKVYATLSAFPGDPSVLW